MGQEIQQEDFDDDAFKTFQERLRDETKILKRWFDDGAFENSDTTMGGLEVEAWLVDENHLPAPRNQDFLEEVSDPLVVPELSQFNFEINTHPYVITGSFFSDTANALQATWQKCQTAAGALHLRPLTIGCLPTVRGEMLQLDTMSSSNRYRALNAQLFRMRGGDPVEIHIRGTDELTLSNSSLMIEAACTSIQVHHQMNQADAKRHYNASLIISAPLVAATANAPFLYGKSLWAETRIPTFEQAVPICGFRDRAGRKVGRVTFGTGYVRKSVLELFLENLRDYPVLLPAVTDDPPESLAHLRLQNGTLWRWNRPIIGFNGSGRPHLRIEHRVMAAGPSLTDMIANMALNLGLALAYGNRETPPEDQLPFETSRSNFYTAAQSGLDAQIDWLDGRGSVQALLLERLLPEAKGALAACGIDQADLDYYFDTVLHRRLLTGRTGAFWQRAFVDVYGPDFQALTERYCELQEVGLPVHEWVV